MNAIDIEISYIVRAPKYTSTPIRVRARFNQALRATRDGSAKFLVP